MSNRKGSNFTSQKYKKDSSNVILQIIAYRKSNNTIYTIHRYKIYKINTDVFHISKMSSTHGIRYLYNYIVAYANIYNIITIISGDVMKSDYSKADLLSLNMYAEKRFHKLTKFLNPLRMDWINHIK